MHIKAFILQLPNQEKVNANTGLSWIPYHHLLLNRVSKVFIKDEIYALRDLEK